MSLCETEKKRNIEREEERLKGGHRAEGKRGGDEDNLKAVLCPKI